MKQPLTDRFFNATIPLPVISRTLQGSASVFYGWLVPLFALMLILSPAVLQTAGAQSQQTWAVSGTFTVPAGVTQITVECWGAGGGGSSINANNRRGGGGGGGAYARSVLNVSPDQVFNVNVGTGGMQNTSGGSTSFGNLVVAEGGQAGQNNNSGGGSGGQASASTGQVRYSGGNGGGGGTVSSGGGGGAAGSGGNGGNATGATGGGGQLPNGGNGANGVNGSSDGRSGLIFGGGGSGAVTNSNISRTGGAGAGGYVIVSYTLPPQISATPSSIDFGHVNAGLTSGIKTIQVTALSLNGAPGNLTVSLNAPFEVSLSPEAGFSTSLQIPYNSSTLGATALYVRYRPLLPNSNYSSDLQIQGGGAIALVSLSGNSFPPEYCSSASVNFQEYEAITRVSFAGIDNASQVVKPAGYTDYTQSVAAAELVAGRIYPIAISETFASVPDNGYCKVFIDFNRNGIFEQPAEVVFSGDYTGSVTLLGDVFVPVNALPGSTRMRVIIKGDGTEADTEPCGLYSWGETEDYPVSISRSESPLLSVYPAVLNFGYETAGSQSDAVSFILSGVNLSPASGIIPISAPAGFEISASSDSDYSSSLQISYTGGSLPSTTLYARFRPADEGQSYTGRMILNGGGALQTAVTLTGTSILYCTGWGNLNSAAGITYVSVSTMANSSGKTSGYSDYYPVFAAKVTAGEQTQLTVHVNTGINGSSTTRAWIDWNANGLFTDPGEEYDLGLATNTPAGATSDSPLTIAVPAEAFPGFTRMRIVTSRNENPQPCITGFDGEVEDYAVEVVLPATQSYRTIATGTWHDPEIWECSENNGLNWFPALMPPTSADGRILIRNTHLVALETPVVADQLKLESGAVLTLLAGLTLADGPGTDFEAGGLLDCGSNLVTGEGSFLLLPGGALSTAHSEGITLSGDNGSIRTAGRAFSPATDYTFCGTVPQSTGNGMPSLVRNLVVANPTGLTAPGNLTITGMLSLEEGIFMPQGDVLAFREGDIPISKTNGTLRLSPEISLMFGSSESQGGSAFEIPAGIFSDPPAVKELIINRTNSIALGDQMISVNAGVLVAKGTLITNSNLTLISTAGSTALIDGSGSGSVLGQVAVQRYLASGYGYKYLGSPFSDAVVGGFSGTIDLGADFPSFYYYDENREASGWQAYTSPELPLLPLNGYAAQSGTDAAPKTLVLKGTVNNGPVGPVALFNHNRTFTQGFNLVSNPYPSPIDWDAAQGWIRDGIDDAVYFFNPGTNDQYGGSYGTYKNGISSDGTAGPVIASMQGFFIRVSDGQYPVQASFGMDNRVRVNEPSAIFHKHGNAEDRTIVRLEARAGTADHLVIILDPEASADFRSGEDAIKLENTGAEVPNLYARTADNKKVVIGSWPQSDEVTEIPLGLKLQSPAQVRLVLTECKNLPSGIRVFLHDKKTAEIKEMKEPEGMEFYLPEGDHGARFSLLFSEKDLSQGPLSEESFNVRFSEGRLVVELYTAVRGEVRIFNVSGRQIFSGILEGKGIHTLDAAPAAGVYVVSFVSEGHVFSKKIIIR